MRPVGLLALLLHTQSNSLERAQQIARSMTVDLRRAALTDRLTGLPNRAAILEKVQDAIHRAQHVADYHYAVLFIDFDRFKIINDSLGHSAGDDLLVAISRRLTQALRRHDVSSRFLHLEVTESQIMQDRRLATANLQKLRRIGVRIDIDDFGTGHSSLACIHEFPIDTLKIDRSFIANLETDPNLSTVLRTVTDLARNLGVQVVAEGIETTAQLELLRSLNCEFAQGYLFSKPASPEDVASYCAARDAEGYRFAA